MTGSDKIRLLIIGAGKMGHEHANAFSKNILVEIVAVSSRTSESAMKLAKRFGLAFYGTDWREEARRSNATAAVIAVPHLLTEKTAEEVLEYGLHILVEKPVSLHSVGTKALGRLAESKGLIAMVAMNRRFYSTVLDAILTSKYYGNILALTVIAPDPVSSYRAEGKYDPIVYDEWFKMNTIHIIDLMRLIAGDVLEVNAISNKVGYEKSRVALVKFKSGISGSFVSINSMGGMNQWELILHGEGVEVRLKPLERGNIIYADGSSKPIVISRKDNMKPGLLAQANTFVNSILLGKVCFPGSDLDDHARTLELAELM
ncbi:MAG: Gfo/Idh/MocA family oxidoreductase [Cyclobacteriaceae bacterium]|nr:Gfo/Idh/MocA family oxidoreductase [Cyclobacteriaceae bacterium]